MTATVSAAEVAAGYSGLYLAARLAGWPIELEWLSEVDPDPSKILAYHHPGVPNLGDMTAIDWERVATPEVIAGGIPCTGWSLAGKRMGSDDERDLWPIRKTDAEGNPRRGAVDMLRVLRPRVFLLENVASLVNAEGGVPWGTILADLHELGYNAGWVTIGACRVGACHHRHRVFLIATLGDVVPPEGLLFGVPLSAAAKWPTSGLMVDGQVWPLDIEVCGAPVSASNMLPTPPAVAYGSNQSPSAGAAVRPSLEGVMQLLPTPTAHLEPNRRGMPNPDTARQRMESGRRNLEDALALLPTPRARDVKGGETEDSRRARINRGTAHEGHDLPTVVSMLPTPTARDATRGAGRKQPEGRPLSEVIALLPTPRALDSTGVRGVTPNRTAEANARAGMTLTDIVHALLPTPRASDAEKGGPNQRGSSGDVMLPSAVQPGRFGQYEPAVRRHEQVFGVPAPEPTEPGRHGKPRLSPAFPEFMQMLPPGWLTDLIGDKKDPSRITRNAAIKAAGNGVNPWQGALAIRLLSEHMPNLMPAVEMVGVAA